MKIVWEDFEGGAVVRLNGLHMGDILKDTSIGPGWSYFMMRGHEGLCEDIPEGKRLLEAAIERWVSELV